jgi:hypothetical protein
VRGLASRIHWYPERYTLEDSYSLLQWRVFAIGPMSADQRKQISILQGATSFNMRSTFVRQNGNFEKSQGRSEKFENP